MVFVGPRKNYKPYNETPTKGNIMKNSETPILDRIERFIETKIFRLSPR